jgi:hypothetical protein
VTLESRARVVRGAAIVLQLVAGALVATALVGVAGATIEAAGHPGVGIDAWSALELIVLLGLLAIGAIGLRRWMAGGSPTLLYGFDVLPLVFLLTTAGPGALQDPLGLSIAAAFVVPLLVTWAASAGGGEAPA